MDKEVIFKFVYYSIDSNRWSAMRGELWCQDIFLLKELAIKLGRYAQTPFSIMDSFF